MKLGGGRAAELDTHKKFCESNAFGSEVLDSAKDAVVEFPGTVPESAYPAHGGVEGQAMPENRTN